MQYLGPRITTKAYLTRVEDTYVVTENPLKGSTLYKAVWKTATVSNWWPIQRNANPVEQERKAWEILLLETNLIPDLTHEEDVVSDESLKKILSLIPGKLPSLLARIMLSQTFLTTREANQIERESMLLWGGSGNQKSREYHPMLEKVANAMGMWEKFGVKTWDFLGDLSTYDFQSIMHCLSCYSNMMKLNEMQRKARADAVKQSGATQYFGK